LQLDHRVPHGYLAPVDHIPVWGIVHRLGHPAKHLSNLVLHLPNPSYASNRDLKAGKWF
jgi:hypothetical protein